jgi:hypothetical protein
MLAGKVSTITTTFVLAALLVCFSFQVGRTAASLIPTDAEATNTADPTDPMFPDGLEYDFGKVQRGIQAYHTFRIVNTSKAPLRIVSLRRGG